MIRTIPFTLDITVTRDEADVVFSVEGTAYPPVPERGPSYSSGGEPGEAAELVSYVATDPDGQLVLLSDAEVDRLALLVAETL